MSEAPQTSIVVPMRNEAPHLDGLLESLARQDLPLDRFEVIVADGQSDDGSAEIVRRWQGELPNLRLVENPERATSFGMNRAIRASRGRVIVLLGAHSRVPEGFVRESLGALEKSGAEVAGGVIDTVGETGLARAVAVAQASRFGVGDVAFRQSETEGFVDTVAFAAYRRSVFERIGLFDEELVRNQDDELNYRLRSHGGRIFLTPRVRVVYYVRSTLRALAEQYGRYGFWKVRVLQKHPRMMQTRQFVPPLSVAAGFGSLVASAVEPRMLYVAGPLAAAYASTVALASVAVAWRRAEWSLAPRLAVVFPILHLSYGFGFLLGLVRFLPRWWTKEPEPPRLTQSVKTGCQA